MSYRSEVEADSPALWWRLGESAGTEAADASGNARKGTYGEGVTLGQASLLTNEPGDPSVSLSATSTGRITSAYAAFTVGSTRTFEGWARRTGSATQDTLFGGVGAGPPVLRMEAGAPGEPKFFPAGGAQVVGWAAAWPGNNQNVHWALVYNDATFVAELFINGESKGKKETMVAGYTTPGNFVAGAWSGTFQQPWHGQVDEIAVYTSGLSSARIKAHYEAGIAEPSKGGSQFPLSRRHRIANF